MRGLPLIASVPIRTVYPSGALFADVFHADVAVGAGLVLHHHLLSERVRDIIADDTRGNVRGTGGRKRNDEVNRARRPIRRPCRRHQKRESEHTNNETYFQHSHNSPLFRPATDMVSALSPRYARTPSRLSGSGNSHAVLEVSSRAHGRHQACDAGTVYCRLLCRAGAGLYRRHLRHRRHRHGENLMAHHIGLEQAAIQQARCSEFRYG